MTPNAIDTTGERDFSIIASSACSVGSNSGRSRPENDPELNESFVFIDNPEAPDPVRYDEIVRINSGDIILIIGIPALLIFLWTHYRRRTEKSEGIWEES